MMFKLPTYFRVKSESKRSVDTSWETSTITTEKKLLCRSLVSANSTEEGFAAEDMYAMALSNSFVSTFKTLATESDLHYENLNVLTTLGIDRNSKGLIWLSTADFKVTLHQPSSNDLAVSILNRTSECCLVLNSINTDKHFQFEIVGQ